MVELTADGSRSWSILVEAAPNREASFIDIGTIRTLLRAMGDQDGVALHASDRVAVQVQVQARDVLGALGEALTRWRAAAAESLPAGWHLVRAEVLTLEEFERHWELG